LVWATKKRERLLLQDIAKKVSRHLQENADAKGIYMKLNYVNADHVHALIDLPSDVCIRDAVKLLKGESSHWINQTRMTTGSFAWQVGYGAFSVSHSRLNAVCQYIANQPEHHRRKPFAEEFKEFVESYGMKWREDDGD
jgi:REP element-mobilizing transposase RayT